LAICIRWPKYWSFSFSISPSNEYSGLISFRIDWFDLFAVQGNPKSLLRHHNSKATFTGLGGHRGEMLDTKPALAELTIQYGKILAMG